MTIYIGQASKDEHGRYVGGQPGNQTGTELNTRPLWDNDWKYLIVWKDDALGQKCADLVAAIVANMHFGYAQDTRNTGFLIAKAVAYVISKVAKDGNLDCTSLNSTGAMGAGAPEAIFYAGGNCAYTGNFPERARQTGLFHVYEGLSYGEIQAKARIGSFIQSSGHSVTVLSGAPGGSASTPSISATLSVEEVAQAVIRNIYGNQPERQKAIEALGVDYNAVRLRVNELLEGTPNAAGTSTGKPRIIAGRYKVIVNPGSKLNVRSAPSRSAKAVAEYARGEYINSIAADITEADGYTWAHYNRKVGGIGYVAVGTTDGSEKYLAKA